MRVKIMTHVGPIRATFTDDWERGETTYEVTGTRVSGVFTVCLEQHIYRDEFLDLESDRVRVGMGRQNGRPFDTYQREDRPVVNGVDLCGDMVINVSRMREGRLNKWSMSVRRGRREGSAPDSTADRTAAVVEGLLTHWLTRPEHYALRLAATRWTAVKERRFLLERVEEARKAFEAARGKLEDAEDALAEAAVFAAMPQAALEDATLAEVRPA